MVITNNLISVVTIESDIEISMYSLSLLSVTVTVILLWRKFCDWSMNDLLWQLHVYS